MSNFEKVVVAVLIIWAAAVLCRIVVYPGRVPWEMEPAKQETVQ